MGRLYVDGPRVMAFTGSESGCTLWRTYGPFAELQRRGYMAVFRDKDDPESLKKEWPFLMASRLDAVILPRMAWTDYDAGERYFNALHRAQLVVLYELDDDALSPGIVQRQFNTHERERVKGLEQLERDRLDRIHCMQQCDGVTVTTQRLKTIVSQYTDKPIEVVPNAIDVKWWRQTIHGAPRLVPGLTIGWAGGNRYPEDLYPVAEAWGRIARKYPAVTFIVQGYMAPEILECVPEDRLRVIPWLPLEQYPRGLVNIDIGCCAVAPKLFNTAKTPIKLWEFTLSGAVCVVSPTLYGPVTTDGVDGLVAETADQWTDCLSALVEDPELRRRLYRNQRRRTVTEHSLEANWQNWPNAWARLINAFHETQQSPLAMVS